MFYRIMPHYNPPQTFQWQKHEAIVVCISGGSWWFGQTSRLILSGLVNSLSDPLSGDSCWTQLVSLRQLISAPGVSHDPASRLASACFLAYSRDTRQQISISNLFLGALYVIPANISLAKESQMTEPIEKANHPTHGVKVLQLLV